MTGCYPPKSVLIIHPQQVLRKDLTDLVNREPDLFVLGEASNAEQAAALVQDDRADVIVASLPCDDEAGPPLMQLMRSTDRPVPVVVVTMQDHPGECERVMDAGVHGSLAAHEVRESLIEAIRIVLAGGVYFRCFQPSKPSSWFG